MTPVKTTVEPNFAMGLLCLVHIWGTQTKYVQILIHMGMGQNKGHIAKRDGVLCNFPFNPP